MLFNKNSKGTQELRELTGNYFANNNFEKIKPELELASTELASLVGEKLLESAEKIYLSGDPNEKDRELVKYIQRPIALIATLHLYQKNDLSHEDDGRKFKISTDNSEKLPWEWQLDRDDALHLEEHYRAVDHLIRYLNKTNNSEWKESTAYKTSQTLLIRNGEEFENFFPIEKSERMFLMLVPFLKEVQILHTKKSYGSEKWDGLLREDQASDVRFAACKATALLAVSTALRRMPLHLIPSGVIRNYAARNGAMKSDPASLSEVRMLTEWIKEDGLSWLDEMKKLRDGGQVERTLLHDNNEHNKYFIL